MALLKRVYVGLASEDEFARAEMARAPFLADISFVVESTEDASRVLLVSRIPSQNRIFSLFSKRVGLRVGC